MLSSRLGSLLLYPLVERLQGRQIRAKLAVLREEQSRPAAERCALQGQRLARILRLAGRNVPYYRDLFRAMAFDPEKAASAPGCLLEIPYLTKDIIREQGDRLLNERLPKEALHLRKTGASTGPSASIYYSTGDLDWTAAANLLVNAWAGKRPGEREVHLASRFPEAFPLRDRIKEWAKCTVLNRVNIFTDSLDDAGLERIWLLLKRAKPYLLQGHPSTMYALSRHVLGRKYLTAGILQVFESTGEVLDDRKRQTIEDAFGCTVVNRYGNAEFGVIASEVKGGARGRLRVLDPLVWVETGAAGESEGELVVTGLANQAMPLIRYRTGDLGTLLRQSDGDYLTAVSGRVHDMVHIGGRPYPTHYLQDLLGRLEGIAEFQFVQRNSGSLLLRLVPESSAAKEALAQRINGWWGGHVKVEFVGFDGLRRCGRAGKFRFLAEE